MKHSPKHAEAIAARINTGRQSGLAHLSGTTPEEIRDSFMRTFRDKDAGDYTQLKGSHDHTEKKHSLG